MKGIKRFRQAIKNQRDAGEGEFRLTYHDAEEIAAEIEDEFESLSWAAGVPAPKDADGEVVPLTTKVMYDDDGRKLEGSNYKSFIWSHEMGRWYFCASVGSYRVSNLHLTSHDSWEKLEEDVQKIAGGGICDYFGAKACDESCPAKCAPVSCSMYALKDILRRAKALAGRGED